LTPWQDEIINMIQVNNRLSDMNDKLIYWHFDSDMKTGWHYDRVSWWQVDTTAGWHGDRLALWEGVIMTGWHYGREILWLTEQVVSCKSLQHTGCTNQIAKSCRESGSKYSDVHKRSPQVNFLEKVV